MLPAGPSRASGLQTRSHRSLREGFEERVSIVQPYEGSWSSVVVVVVSLSVLQWPEARADAGLGA